MAGRHKKCTQWIGTFSMKIGIFGGNNILRFMHLVSLHVSRFKKVEIIGNESWQE